MSLPNNKVPATSVGATGVDQSFQASGIQPPVTPVTENAFYQVKENVAAGELTLILLELLERALHAFQLRGEKPESTDLTKREPAPLLKLVSAEEKAEELRGFVIPLKRQFPLQAFRFKRFGSLVQRILDARSVQDLLELWSEVLEFEQRLRLPRSEAILPSGNGGGQAPEAFDVTIDADPKRNSLQLRLREGADPLNDALEAIVRRTNEEQRFLAFLMQHLDGTRQKGRELTHPDRIAVEHAYAMMDEGTQLPRNFQGLGTSGFRRWQTNLSLADPGDGHLKVTVRDASLLAGVVVHVEHIDRDKVPDREKLEPYRLPATRNAARVRLHAGSAAPVSAFIGRPVFENQSFGLDLLKSAHMTASACTAMFAQGIVDCKIGMERMTASESIEFMRAVAGNVIRTRSHQTLSAAFNINTRLVDDRSEAGSPGIIEQPFDLAQLGIELVVAGGFDKIAWDGASNKIPSDPIIGQLTFSRLMTLVHHAHEAGLETYISAGLHPEHMSLATYLGVGGVGIGTSLHFSDPVTKLLGELKPDAIRLALKTRDEAAAEPRGIAARWLAWLDRLYFEGALVVELEPWRGKLFEALSNEPDVDEVAVELSLKEIAKLAVLQEGAVLPVPLGDSDRELTDIPGRAMLARASRLLNVVDSGRQTVASAAVPEKLWGLNIQNIRNLAQSGDEAALANYFSR